VAAKFEQTAGEGPLLLADISGYTSFLQAVATAHQDDAFADGAVPEAYRMMSSLLDGIVTSVVPPFTLSKLEGDAVFAFARIGPDVPRGDAVLAWIRRCHADFGARLAQVGELWTCSCDACSRANTLDLKFILHAGRFVEQEIAGSRELSGPDVVMAHRLLKNHGAEVVGHGSYGLLSAAAVSQLDVPIDAAVPATETYEHYQPIDVFVFDMH
jgi:hypothetical protein